MIFNPAVAGGGSVETVTGTVTSGRFAAMVSFVDADGVLQESVGEGQYEIPKNSIILAGGDSSPTTSGSIQRITGKGYFVSGDFQLDYP